MTTLTLQHVVVDADVAKHTNYAIECRLAASDPSKDGFYRYLAATGEVDWLSGLYDVLSPADRSRLVEDVLRVAGESGSH